MPDLNEELGGLALFLAVAEERSFTRAAVRLGVSQSALSHSVRRLEAKLGLQLLARTTRSVALTDAGERLVETLAPALRAITEKLTVLTTLRDRPAGTVRISASVHAARYILWPAIDRLAAEYPEISVEIRSDSGLVDIVAERLDAGIRLGERLEQDMVAVRIGPQLRLATAGSPAYLAKWGIPSTPEQLTSHSCVNLRRVSGGIYAWEYEKDGHKLKVKVDGQLVLNDIDLIVDAAVAGHGLVHLMEDRLASSLEEGRLVRVLEDWCQPFDGYYLYYPSRKQPSAAFRILLEALRYRGSQQVTDHLT